MKLKKISFFILLFILLLNSSIIFFKHQNIFTNPIDFQSLKQEYQNSQYVNPNATDWIDDPPLYTFAGINYIKGIDPSIINFELQPLTKYFFGLSTLMFGNPSVFQLILYNSLLVIAYFLSHKIINNRLLSLIPVLFLSLDPLIKTHSYTPYVDLFQANLILLCLLFIPKNKHITTFTLFGLLALSKSFMIGILMFFCYLVFMFVNKKVNFSQIITHSLVSIAVYLLGYLAYFIHQNSLLDFINLHIDILKLYKGYVPEYPKFEVFRIIVFGKWRKWYGDFGLASVESWWIFWPITLLFSFVQIAKNKLDLENKHLQIVIIFTIFYLLTISLKLVFPRYIIPILPLLYILSTKLLISKIISKKLY